MRSSAGKNDSAKSEPFDAMAGDTAPLRTSAT
jgi:hypothetical protein